MNKATQKKTGQSSQISAGFSPRAIKSLQETTGESPSGGSETPSPPEKPPEGTAAKKAPLTGPESKGGVVRFKKAK